MERSIIHSDFNNFYASVECLSTPSLKRHPFAVIGDPESRHGIVLSKNELAKSFGIKTGESILTARQKCPELELVPSHFDKYIKYSRLANEIYFGFTDKVEPFGLDECWLDMTRFKGMYGTDEQVADTIRNTVKKELGLTVSVGASFNKVFAKLGSDITKPDTTTVISSARYKKLIWQLPVSDLLYVGKATTAKLQVYNIKTIGDLAKTDRHFLKCILGKNGVMLWNFANGNDNSPVAEYGQFPPVKSIGNGTTAPRDLVSDDDIKITLLSICESVAARLREHNCRCRTVQLLVKDCEFFTYERQYRLSYPTNTTKEIFNIAFSLYKKHHTSGKPVRGLAVKTSNLSITANDIVQLSIFPEEMHNIKQRDIERTIDSIRSKFGYNSIKRGIALIDPSLDSDIKGEHIIYPTGFFKALK